MRAKCFRLQQTSFQKRGNISDSVVSIESVSVSLYCFVSFVLAFTGYLVGKSFHELAIMPDSIHVTDTL